jgi:RNA polymerase sigma-70 factor (ECF subfamily)
MSDETLVQRAQAGSLPCFAELLRRFEGKVFNFILRRVGGSNNRGGLADAEDLTQETFLRAWEHLRTFTPRFRFSTWLFTIAGRVAIDHLRSRRVRQEAMELMRDRAEDRECSLEGDMLRGDSRDDAVMQGSALWARAERVLNPEQHTALWLRYAEGLAPPEIGRVLGRTQVAVRVMLFRARKALAASVSEPVDRGQVAHSRPGVTPHRPANLTHKHDVARKVAAAREPAAGGVT